MRYSDLKGAIEHIKAHVNILKVILEDTGAETKETSSENHFIFCPLHQETHKASFCISDWRKTFRCFGCQETGDVVKWTQIWRGISAVEAIEYLAAKYGLDLSSYVRPPTAEDIQRERYQEICDKAIVWCHTQFINNKQLVGWYRDDTGFSEDQIDDYKIGWCPNLDSLTNFLFRSIPNITKSEIEKLELDKPTQFSDSLIYPVLDLSGHVTRIYSKPLNPSPTVTYKYIGTSSSHPLFQKGAVFGLYQIRRTLKDKAYKVALCEGFKATIAAGGIGVMGTSIADEQVETLYDVGVRQIITCFDGDYAGYAASIKCAEEIARFKGIILKIAQLPIDTQCDTLIKTQGKGALDDVIANAKVPIEFIVTTQYDLTKELTLETKYKILNDISPVVTKMSDIELDIAASYLCKILSTTQDSIKSYVCDLRAGHTKLINNKAEETVLQQAMLNPECWAKLKTALFTDQYFGYTDHQKIFNAIAKAYTQYSTGLTVLVVKTNLDNIYPSEASRLIQRVTAIVGIDIEYTFDAASSILTDLYRRRTAIKQAQELQSRMADPSQTPLEAINHFRRASISTVDVNENQAVEPRPLADKIAQIIAERTRSDKKIIGYDFSSALPALNIVLSGIQERHQIIISANQGVGKSLLALNIVNPIAIDQRVPWLWIAQEMSEDELVMRLLSIRSGINNNRLQMGSFKTHEEMFAYQKALDDYSKGQLYIRRPQSGNIDEIFALAEEYKFKYGIKGITWDYMQLVIASREQRGMSPLEVLQEASNIMTNRVAGTLGLASMCIAQLNRTDYKKGQIRESENMGGAYKIAQDATDVITINEKTPKQIADEGPSRGNRIINVDKRRGGPGDLLIHANLDRSDKISLRFTECVTPEEMMGFTSSMAA